MYIVNDEFKVFLIFNRDDNDFFFVTSKDSDVFERVSAVVNEVISKSLDNLFVVFLVFDNVIKGSKRVQVFNVVS